jgi:uncharacterized protein
MQLQHTALYAAMLGLMMIVLRMIVTIMRAKTGISIEHNGNMALAERIRWHGNFIKNVPMALILMGLAETGGASPTLLNASGVILIVSRILHPFGLKHDNAKAVLRIVSGVGTTLSILLCIGAILWQLYSK